MIKINKYYLNLIFFSFIFLSLNLIFIFLYPSVSGDAYTIKLVAKNILDNFCISLSIPESGECKAHWGSNQGPGYPLLIAYSFYFFGENFLPIRLFQLIVHYLSILFLLKQLNKHIKNFSYFYCSLVLFFSPLTIGWHRSILTESLIFSLCILLFSILVPLFYKKNINVFFLGLILVIGFFIRYDFILFVIPICIILFLYLDFKLFLITGLKISILCILLVSPYIYRNHNLGLNLIPPTQIGLHVENGPKTPKGYVSWLSTWSFTNYMYASALYPTDYGNYAEIKINEKAYFNNKQKKIINNNLEILKSYKGQPMPENIDKSFMQIASYNKENYTFYVYVILPFKRFAALWFNPVTSLGFPGSFNDSNISISNFMQFNFDKKLDFVKDHFIGIFGKVINFIYRVILLSLFVFSIVKIIKNKQNFFYNPIILAGSYFILKSLFLSYTLYTATRHIVTSAIFIELFIIFFLVNKKNFLSKI